MLGTTDRYSWHPIKVHMIPCTLAYTLHLSILYSHRSDSDQIRPIMFFRYFIVDSKMKHDTVEQMAY